MAAELRRRRRARGLGESCFSGSEFEAVVETFRIKFTLVVVVANGKFAFRPACASRVELRSYD